MGRYVKPLWVAIPTSWIRPYTPFLGEHVLLPERLLSGRLLRISGHSTLITSKQKGPLEVPSIHQSSCFLYSFTSVTAVSIAAPHTLWFRRACFSSSIVSPPSTARYANLWILFFTQRWGLLC